jgi:hypothetical protein
MGLMQRRKGQVGEREIAHLLSDLIGTNVERLVRQHDGDSDLGGLPGWSVEVKRAKAPYVSTWWKQTMVQAALADRRPVLFYRIDGRKWRAVWSLSCVLADHLPGWIGLDMTVESSIEAWAAVYREISAREADPLPWPSPAAKTPENAARARSRTLPTIEVSPP